MPVGSLEDEGKPNKYLGVMRRDYLCALLSWRNFDGTPKLLQDDLNDRRPPMEDWVSIESQFGNYPTIDQAVADLDDHQLEKYIDLEPYMNPNAYTLFHTALVTRAYTLFRSMGLRALPVLDADGIVVGMITRQNLLHESIHQGRAIAEEKRPEDFKGSHFSHGGHSSHGGHAASDPDPGDTGHTPRGDVRLDGVIPQDDD